MNLVPTRWLIERGTPQHPHGLYLHVFDDGNDVWSPDQNRALRFATSLDARRYGSGLDEAFHAVEVSTALLAVPHDFEDEDDEDLAAG